MEENSNINNANLIDEKSNESCEKIFLKILINIEKIIGILVTIFLFIASFTHTAYFCTNEINFYHEGLYYVQDNILINILGIIIITLLLIIFSRILKNVNTKILLIISLCVIALFGILWINFVLAPVKSDQGQVLQDAKCFSSGDLSPLKEYGYLYSHPLQLGITLFEALIIKIFHNSENLFFQKINIIFILGIVYLIYKIIFEIFKDEKIQKIALFIMIFLIIIPIYSVVVYGNIYGLLFILFSIYELIRFLEFKHVKNLFFTVIFSIISILLKSNYEIIVIAMIIVLILDLIKKGNLKTLLLIILLVFSIVFSYKILFFVFEKVTNSKINDGIPMITYIAMSINQKPISRNSGWYGEDTNVETIYHASSFNSQDTKNVSEMIIKDRIIYFLKNPIIAIKFYQDKICSTWIEPAFQTLWWSEPLEAYPSLEDTQKEYYDNNELYQNIFTGSLNKIILKYLDFFENIIFLFTIIYLINSLRNKDYDYKTQIGMIAFLGGFLFHILWETKCIYVIPFYLMLIPYASFGINITSEYLDKTMKNLKTKRKMSKDLIKGD